MNDRTRDSYDALAAPYARRYDDELTRKPYDRALLAVFAERARAAAAAHPTPTVADLGCGPGQVAAHLHSLGLDTTGVDISPGMLAVARELHPDVAFVEGDLLALPVPDQAWDGITAFYAICHVDPGALPAVFTEMRRALRPGGPLLLAFHVGDEVRHVDDMLDTRVDLDFHFHPMATVATALEQSGLTVESTLQRRPHEPHESTQRGYVLATRSD